MITGGGDCEGVGEIVPLTSVLRNGGTLSLAAPAVLIRVLAAEGQSEPLEIHSKLGGTDSHFVHILIATIHAVMLETQFVPSWVPPLTQASVPAPAPDPPVRTPLSCVQKVPERGNGGDHDGTPRSNDTSYYKLPSVCQEGKTSLSLSLQYWFNSWSRGDREGKGQGLDEEGMEEKKTAAGGCSLHFVKLGEMLRVYGKSMGGVARGRIVEVSLTLRDIFSGELDVAWGGSSPMEVVRTGGEMWEAGCGAGMSEAVAEGSKAEAGPNVDAAVRRMLGVFKDVSAMWRELKDKLALPLLKEVHLQHGFGDPVPSLLHLPSELKLRILQRLSAPSLATLCQVSSELSYFAGDDRLWQMLYEKEFGGGGGGLELSGLASTWKEAFATKWSERRRRMVRMAEEESHFWPLHRRWAPPHFMPPCIIGGNYVRGPRFGFAPGGGEGHCIGGGYGNGSIGPRPMSPFGLGRADFESGLEECVPDYDPFILHGGGSRAKRAARGDEWMTSSSIPRLPRGFGGGGGMGGGGMGHFGGFGGSGYI